MTSDSLQTIKISKATPMDSDSQVLDSAASTSVGTVLQGFFDNSSCLDGSQGAH